MKIFLDSADTKEIREYVDSGLVDGVTTNPSLAAKTGRDYVEVLEELCGLLPSGSISAEVKARSSSASLIAIGLSVPVVGAFSRPSRMDSHVAMTNPSNSASLLGKCL